jgi:nickel-dependent lactate racemase
MNRLIAEEGSPLAPLSQGDVHSIMEANTPAHLFSGKRVLVLTPDATRTCPLPMIIRVVREVVGSRCAQLDFMVSLGTHPIMSEERILELYGITPRQRQAQFPNSLFLNHHWELPENFHRMGYLTEDEVESISGGLFRERVPIDINKTIYGYDLILVLGPVFPHEVVGFSGGAKYLFPGISGGEFLHFFHWLGAVVTCKEIIGIKETPVRRVIHQALEKIPIPVYCLAMVVGRDASLCGLYVGDPVDAWSSAADLSARVHIVTKKRPYRMVLGRSPRMYDEIWTAGKVMYKLEQVVADGGTLIIYAPHIREVSRVWGEHIEKVGYHVRDYFLGQMERFGDVPRGVLAHSTHVRGLGTYRDGIERPRIDVVLATGISRETCEKVNLGYMDPDEVRVFDYVNKEESGILFVDHAGEILYRLEDKAS